MKKKHIHFYNLHTGICDCGKQLDMNQNKKNMKRQTKSSSISGTSEEKKLKTAYFFNDNIDFGEPNKSKLIAWAKNEIKEYQKFIKLLTK